MSNALLALEKQDRATERLESLGYEILSIHWGAVYDSYAVNLQHGDLIVSFNTDGKMLFDNDDATVKQFIDNHIISQSGRQIDDEPYSLENPTKRDVMAYIDDTNFRLFRVVEYAVDDFCPYEDGSHPVSHDHRENLKRLMDFYAGLPD